MVLTPAQTLILIGAIALATLITRFLPFVLFPAGRQTPAYVVYLGQVLPYAVIGLLVVYCLKGVTLLSAPYGLPEAIGVIATALLHRWKKNTLLSIAGGTAVYWCLVQFLF